jgi:phosphoglycerate dehydrogenase-like enzyme
MPERLRCHEVGVVKFGRIGFLLATCASALDAMDTVILTPHVAAFTDERQARVGSAVCHDVAAVLDGCRAVYPANAPAQRAVPV